MIKEDVAYAKEQYKIALAEYGKVRNHISEIKKKDRCAKFVDT